MSSVLLHSPADVVRRLLIDLGQGSLPPASPWPVYAAGEPSSPDEVLTVRDTAGRDDGRSQVTGQRGEHPGIQVRVRARDHATGYAKARAVAVALDEDVFRAAVTVDGTTYCIHAVTRTGNVLSLGKESPTSKRSLFTVNALVYLTAL